MCTLRRTLLLGWLASQLHVTASYQRLPHLNHSRGLLITLLCQKKKKRQIELKEYEQYAFDNLAHLN